jgi:succinyl-CoA synthetase beta subunit
MGSAAGGVDIEQVAEDTPHALPGPPDRLRHGPERQAGPSADEDHGRPLQAVHRQGPQPVEVNPLIIDGDGDLIALDAKINADDNALFRHPDLAAMRDESQEDPTELAASKHDLNYVTLDGNIACMVNGAGLAMATMDVIKLAGGDRPTSSTSAAAHQAERVTEAFKLILSATTCRHPGQYLRRHRALRSDRRGHHRRGQARSASKVPVVVRLEGTNVEQGKQLLADSGLRSSPRTT